MGEKDDVSWKILYIEDDEEDFILTCDMLKRSGGRRIKIVQASTYEAGVDKLAKDYFDAVLVDYDLGRRTGIELIREFSPGYPAPLILYTGHGSREAGLEAMAAGATLYLTKKEANPLLLERAIRYAIELKQKAYELLASREALERELAQRERAEAAVKADLADMERLQMISSQLIQEENIDALYEHILDAATALMRSDMGSFQIYDPERDELRLLAWKGFAPASAQHWKRVQVGSSSFCRWALDRRERVIVTEVQASSLFSSADEMDHFRLSGIAAVQSTPLISRSGQVAGMISTHWREPHRPSERELRLLDLLARQAADLIERSQVEADLRAAQEKYYTLFNSIDEGFCIVEVLFDENDQPLDYRFLEVNQAFEQQTGIANAVGRWMREIAPEHEKHWFETYGQIALTGKPRRFESPASQLGRYYDVYAFRTGRPEERKVAILFKDVFKRKRMEEMLTDRTRELERVNQALSDFALIASHDLQEPLRKIKAFGGLLEAESGAELGEKGKDHLNRITSAAERMSSMIQGLLAYNKVTSRQEQFSAVDLGEIVSDVLADLEALVLQTGGDVAVGRLPTIQGDPLQLRQLFQNLIGNALKFHRPGEQPLVRVTCESSGENQVEIRVKDNGIGFDMKDADRMFAPFVRLVGRSEYEGTGMGLALCQKIVERHNGSLSVFSAPNEGSTFRVILPVGR